MFTKKFDVFNLDHCQHILFVHHGSLLDDGILRLVGSNSDLEVMKVDYTGDELLAREIAKNHPDIVMMSQERTGKLETLFRFLTSSPALEKLRMIVFHTNDNSVDIYNKKQMRAIPSQEFLTIVQGEHAIF